MSSALQPLDPHFDLATAGQADVPGLLVTDAEVQQPRLPAGHDVERLLDDRTLDAAARDRTDHSPVAVHDQPRTDRARRTAPGLHHGRDGDLAAFAQPGSGGRQHVVLGSRSEEHTSELQSLMRTSYAVFCLNK